MLANYFWHSKHLAQNELIYLMLVFQKSKVKSALPLNRARINFFKTDSKKANKQQNLNILRINLTDTISNFLTHV